MSAYKFECLYLVMMYDTEVHNQMEKYVDQEVNSKLQTRLKDLSATLINKFPEHEEIIKSVILKHSYPVRSTLRLDIEKKKRKKREISREDQCMARTGLQLQCRRPKVSYAKGGDDYHCLSHMHSLPYGDIDQDMPNTAVVRKRGRKGKNSKEYTTDDLDPKLYVQAVQVTIEGTTYLLDENEILYGLKDCLIVGYVDAKTDEVIWT